MSVGYDGLADRSFFATCLNLCVLSLSHTVRFSFIGPLLFLLFINDVTDLFDGTVNVKLYADDVKIYFEIIKNASVDCLQKGINDLSTWAEKWQLKFSIDKCFHLRAKLKDYQTSFTHGINHGFGSG